MFWKIDRQIPMEKQAGVTSFEPDQEQNNAFLLELIRHWMFSKSCEVTNSNAFYITERLKLLDREIVNFPSQSKN